MIRDFTIAMIWGVLIGTVSVAAPMLLHLHRRREGADEAAIGASTPKAGGVIGREPASPTFILTGLVAMLEARSKREVRT